jgi:hypothetical protein
MDGKTENTMTALEDQVIDQLYFVTSFQEVKAQSGIIEEELALTLWGLIEKGWVKCFVNPETEIELSESEFNSNYTEYHYLASKKGLMAHNLRE